MEGITKYMRDAPFTINLQEKVKVVVEEVPLKSLPEIYKFYCKYAASMNGVSVDEFDGEADFIEKLSTRDNYCMREAETQRLIAYVQVYPSPLCRSIEPVYNAGYAVRHSDYKSLLLELVALLVARALRYEYHGLIGRACVFNPASYAPGLRIGSSIAGTIPYSVFTPDYGWGDDLLIYRPYSEHRHNRDLLSKIPVLPSKSAKPLPDSLPVTWAKSIEGNIISTGGKAFTCKVASEEERLKVEHMIHDEAGKGNWFGIDEFNKDGSYSRKRFHKSLTVVFRNASKDMVGAMLIGKSSLCRSKVSPMLGVYIVIPEDMVCFDLGRTMYEAAMRLAQHHECEGLITDVFSCCNKLIDLTTKTGFLITGSLPSSAYMAGFGHCDSVLMCYKFLRNTPMPNIMYPQSNM